MAAANVGGAFLGAVFGEVLTVVTDAIHKAYKFRSELEELKSTLESITPTVQEIEKLNGLLDIPGRETAKLMKEMIKGAKLVRESSKVKRFCFFNRVNYAAKIIKLKKSMETFCNVNLQTQMARDNKRILVGVESMVKMLSKNEKGVGVFNRVEIDGPCSPPDPPVSTPGLDAPMKELRTELVKDDGMQVIVVSAPGGAGKTALIKKLCADDQVKDKFQENIFFVTVSKTPDVMVIVKRIFQHKKCAMPTFQTEEATINDLERLLKSIGQKAILLVLDDVWSESVVQKFKFFLMHFQKDDKSRYTVKCLNLHCDWRVHASTVIDGVTFISRSITGGHSLCQRQQMNSEVNSKCIAAAFGALILSNPSIEAAVIKNELRDKFGVQASSQSIYRAKKRVLKNLRADHIEVHTMIWRYANMCIVMNPGTYAKVNTQEIIGENPIFQRLFLSFRAMQTGFVNGCRPLIGIDGCHLTSEYGGVLLAATALDADNRIFPIAYAVCETECKESWIWFLRLLHEALDWDDNKRICFMSDGQKGILAALKSEWPKAKNRYCFRHVFANYNKKFKSLDLTKKVWHAARVSHVAGFNDVMKQIRKVSEEAHTWLMKSKPREWAKHKFVKEIKSDHVTNDMSKRFNRWIKDYRDKPILTLFETLRRKVMVRFTDKLLEIEKLNDNITSYARNRLNETNNKARKLQVIHGRGEYHETMDSRNKSWLVNIGKKTCDCGEWQISGCPCMHALAVLTYNRQHAHDFVHRYYSKEAFQAAYSGVIEPIPDASRWPTVDNVPLDPPLRCTLVGRPKKNRRREPDEGPAAGRIISKKCGTIGHNKRTCTCNGGSK